MTLIYEVMSFSFTGFDKAQQRVLGFSCCLWLRKCGMWKCGMWKYGMWKYGMWKYGMWKCGMWKYGILAQTLRSVG